MNIFLYALLSPAMKIAIRPRFPVAYKNVSMDMVNAYKKKHPLQVITVYTLRKLAKRKEDD